MRLTMRELNGETPNAYFANDLKWPHDVQPIEATATGFYQVEQPADPFDGLADFEVHPLAFELSQVRAVNRLLLAHATAADAALAVAKDSQAREANLIALFDRPLSRLNKKELTGLIRIAQDILVQPVEVIG